MADTFHVVADNKTTHYASAKEAGAAFFEADSAHRPSVVVGRSAGSDTGPEIPARSIATTGIDGRYENGDTRFVKALPRSDSEVDKDFRAGYVEALDKSVNDRLKAADWEAAKPAHPLAVPKLDPRLYDDLDQLSKNDFEKAAKAWEDHAPQGTTGPTFVDREWKRQNDEARQIAAVLDASERGPAYGVMTLDDKTVTSIRFERTDKEGEQAFNVSFHMGNKTVGKLKGIDADTLADSVGDKNAKAIMEHGEAKGSLKGEALMNEYGMSPEESARRSAMKEARKAVELIQMEQLEPDAADEKNIVEPVKEKELEVIDGKEAIAREQESLGIKAEGKRIDVENLSEKALEQDDANDIAERTGGTTDRDSQQYTEREKNRQTAREHKPAPQRSEPERKTDSARQNRPETADKDAGKGLASQAVETAAKTAVRAYAGRVLEHGAANFNHDPKEKPNYFVKLSTDKGEKTVWGVDLNRAMSEGKVKAGDDVKLEFKGNTPVTVEALKRDKAGKVIGREEITTNRNTWDVQKSDKAKVAEAVASALIDSKVKDPAQREALKAAVGARMAEREKTNKVPAVPVYDKAAPAKSQQQERTGPVVERNSERTR